MAPLLAQAVNIDAAKKEGKVVVYGSVVPQAMDDLQSIQKKYGIEVEYWRGYSTQVSERALDRVARRQARVSISSRAIAACS